jgi:DNA-binding Lrp family transcriptional regulator
MIDERDKSIIGLIQGDLPLEKKPFEKMAESLEMPEEEFLKRVRALKKKGIIRRFGATLRHQEAGFSSNAMVAWIVPDDRIEQVGKAMAKFKEVTHCYQRRPQKDWKYNLFTMVHGDDKEACFRVAERMSQATGTNKYILLFSEKEFKKTSMAYF